MKTLLCLAGCISSICICSAQSLHYPFAGNGAYSKQFTDIFSFLSNTAALADCSRAGGGVYAENKFGLRELNEYTAAVLTGINGKGGMGMVVGYSGNAVFNRSQVGLAYAKQLGRVSLGIRFNYAMQRMAGYGGEGAISFELGSICQVTEKLCTGVQISNPRGGKLPAVYSMGAGYECSDQLFISAIITKEESKPLNWQTMLQYVIGGRLLTMLGLNSAIASPLIAAGWIWKNMRVVMSGSLHAQLGPSTGIGIIFYAKKKEEQP